MTSISHLYDSLASQLRALDSLGVTIERYAAMLFPLVESVLPEATFKTWDRYRVSKGTSTKKRDAYLSELLTFLKVEVESEERMKLCQSSFERELKNKRASNKNKGVIEETPSAVALVSTDDFKNKSRWCVFCGKDTHSSQNCVSMIDVFLTETRC